MHKEYFPLHSPVFCMLIHAISSPPERKVMPELEAKYLPPGKKAITEPPEECY